MYILGVNTYHGDSSACLVKDGRLLCAIEEERLRRIKHWAGLPSESIKWCMNYAGISAKNLDYITLSRNPLARLPKKLCRVIFKRPSAKFLSERMGNFAKIRSFKDNLACELSVDSRDIKARVVNVEHHRAHLSSSFFVSPFEEAAAVSIDGFGDFASLMTGVGRRNTLKVIHTVEFPHSLGILYTALTQYLGFWNYGDEYKVMGLSAFGKPVYLEQMRKIVRLTPDGFFQLDTSYFLHDSEGVEMTWLNESPKIGRLFSEKMISLLGPARVDQELDQRFQDIAASLQAIYEAASFHILNHFHKKTGMENLALSGGCIQNSLANGKIYERTGFKHVYIPPAAGDAGGAIGSAFYLWNNSLCKPRAFTMDSAYWGPEFGRQEIRSILGEKNISYQEVSDADLYKRIAGDIARGKIIGWFQGRSEWGPRALGNRSILADPRKKEIKEILNARVKKREWFRPFAPAILEEDACEWFESCAATPFMEKVYSIKEKKKALIPAVCHVDGTGRLETVNRNLNEPFYDLIKAFKALTGVPILLNTSFNENEPIVNTPDDALDCFARVGMDLLVIGNLIVERR